MIIVIETKGRETMWGLFMGPRLAYLGNTNGVLSGATSGVLDLHGVSHLLVAGR